MTARLGPLVENPGLGFQIVATMTLSAGTMFLMWVGDQITDRGIGNGTSLIITVGIVASLPGALVQVWNTFVPTGGAPSRVSPIVLVLMIAFLVLVVASVIALTQGQRKVSIQYAKRVVGRKVYGGQTQYLPLKVNSVGVMPLIFAQAILLFPSTILSMAFRNQEWAVTLSNALAVGFWHYALTAALIFFFSYFWVAIQFQPTQIADDLKKYNGYIPGYRPGKPTAEFLEYTLDPIDFCRRALPDGHRGDSGNHDHLAGSSPDDCAIFWRNEPLDYRRRPAGHDAAGGDAPHSAALRWFLAQRAHPGPL